MLQHFYSCGYSPISTLYGSCSEDSVSGSIIGPNLDDRISLFGSIALGPFNRFCLVCRLPLSESRIVHFLPSQLADPTLSSPSNKRLTIVAILLATET